MSSYLISTSNSQTEDAKTTQSNSATVAVGTTATNFLSNTNAANRIAVTVENPSAAIAYVAIGNAIDNAASVTNHAYLIPANRVVPLNPCPAGELNAILDSGSANLTVIEFLK